MTARPALAALAERLGRGFGVLALLAGIVSAVVGAVALTVWLYEHNAWLALTILCALVLVGTAWWLGDEE